MKLLTQIERETVAGGQNNIPSTIVIPEECIREIGRIDALDSTKEAKTLGDTVNLTNQWVKRVYEAGCGPYLELLIAQHEKRI